MWASQHHHSGLTALCFTAENSPPADSDTLPVRVRVVDAEVGEAASLLARADADAARAAGLPVQIDLDELVARAERSSATTREWN